MMGDYGDELSREDHRRIAEQVVMRLEASRAISNETHEDHHAWLHDEIQKRRKVRERISQWMLKPMVGFMTITGLAAIGRLLYWVGELVLRHWNGSPP